VIADREIRARGAGPVGRVRVDGNGRAGHADIEAEQAAGAGWLDRRGEDPLGDEAGELLELRLRDGRVEADVGIALRVQRRGERAERDQKSCEMKSLLCRKPTGVNATRPSTLRSQPS